MSDSPDIGNLSIFKTKVYFTPTGGVERDIGECPEVELSLEIEKLDYFSSRSGVRTKVKTVVLERSATVRLVYSEMSAKNLALSLMGEVSDVTDGSQAFDIFTVSQLTGSMRMEGTNDVGNRLNVELPSVSITPTGSLNLVSEEWTSGELEAEILEIDGRFGSVEVIDEV